MTPETRQRNYLQAALYVLIASVIAALLLERLLTYAEAVEKATMEATVSRLHTALYAKMAFYALRGEYGAIDSLETRSPFLIADVKSPNYLGEFDGRPSSAQDGSWFYDRVRNELVYLPRLRRHLVLRQEADTEEGLRYRVQVHKASKYGYTGVSVRMVGSARWSPLP